MCTYYFNCIFLKTFAFKDFDKVYSVKMMDNVCNCKFVVFKGRFLKKNFCLQAATFYRNDLKKIEVIPE